MFGILKSPTKKLWLENNVELRGEALDQDVSSREKQVPNSGRPGRVVDGHCVKVLILTSH